MNSFRFYKNYWFGENQENSKHQIWDFLIHKSLPKALVWEFR